MGNESSGIILSMWSPDSGQVWGAEGNENHGTISLEEFLCANSGEENASVREAVLALQPGETAEFGGGAGPYCRVTMLCPCGGFTRNIQGVCAGRHVVGCQWRPCPTCGGISEGNLCCPPTHSDEEAVAIVEFRRLNSRLQYFRARRA